eukprot:scaffold7092_cov262-Pinguiococcus_pyrenoidosus.AAC.46
MSRCTAHLCFFSSCAPRGKCRRERKRWRAREHTTERSQKQEMLADCLTEPRMEALLIPPSAVRAC